MSVPDSSSFPKFADGDVHILTSSGKSYQLHSNVLRRNSTAFNELLTEDRATALTPKQRREGKVVRYRVDLTRVEENDVGVFELRDPSSSSGPSFGLADIFNGRAEKVVYKHYDNLFRAFYNLQLGLDDSNIATALEDSMGLIDVARRLGSMSVVSESIDISLLRQGQVLFRSIASNAMAWSKLANRVKSPSMFREAVIHLVGQWQAIPETDRALLDVEVRDLCRRKYQQLDLQKQAIEIRILGHYSDSLQRLASANPGRNSYSNDIYGWMSVALFRHWFTQCICEGRGRGGQDGGAALYRQIGAGSHAYLTRQDMNTFHQYFPMTSKGSTCLEGCLTSYKEDLKPFVAELLKHRSEVDVSGGPLDHLTCCEVSKADLPWTKKDPEVIDEDSVGRGRRFVWGEPTDEKGIGTNVSDSISGKSGKAKARNAA
ncbi:MAG: hypothetical protein M1837_006500 [Sclerophora amabilis]|nr:MAG: hypothetical protein M1837_006500 [Sclerophora amabilis]